MNNNHVRVVSYQIPPWVYLTYDEKGVINKVWGPVHNIIEILSKANLFTYEYVNPKERFHGNKDKNGSWNGLLGSLQSGEADIVGDPVVPVYQRQLDFGFSLPYVYSPVKILSTPFPVQVSGDLSFTQAFRTEVWILLVTSLICLGVMAWLNESFLKHTKLFQDFARRIIFHSFSFLTKLMGQGNSNANGQAERVLFGVWFLAMIVLMNYFSSAMIAALSTQKAFDTIDNLEDILDFNHGKVQPVILELSAYAAFFQHSPQRIHQRIWKQAVERKGIVSIKRLFSKSQLDSLLQRKSAFIFDDHSMRVQLMSACDKENQFHFSFHSVAEFPMALIYRKDMPIHFVENTNRKLLSIFESGLSEFWLYRETARIARCLPEKGQENVPMAVKVSDILAAFILWLRGLGLAFAVLLTEIVKEKIIMARIKNNLQHKIK